MSYDYSGFASTAARLIDKYGYLATFTKTIDGVYDPDTGSTSPTTSNYTAKIVKSTYSAYEQQNTAIERGDIKLIAEVADFEIGDTLVIDGDIYRIMMPEKVDKNGTPIYYKLQVRK